MTRRIENFVAVERLHEIFFCDPVAGKLFWRSRDTSCYRVAIWNSRFADKEVGSLNTNGHVQVRLTIDGVKFHAMAHRIIWAMTFGEWIPVDLEIDHRNRVRSDNRIVNLRVCTRTDNCRHKGMQKNNKSGFKGVCWYPKYQKWLAQISINGSLKNLGYFYNVDDAVAAYDLAAQSNFGSFSVTNRQMGLAA